MSSTNQPATDSAPGLPVAGWYTDPADPAALRFWDGSAWTPHSSERPASRESPAQGPSARDSVQPAVISGAEPQELPTYGSDEDGDAGHHRSGVPDAGQWESQLRRLGIRRKYVPVLSAELDSAGVGGDAAVFSARLFPPRTFGGAGIAVVAENEYLVIDTGPMGTVVERLPLNTLCDVRHKFGESITAVASDGRTLAVERTTGLKAALRSRIATVAPEGAWWAAPETTFPRQSLAVDYLGGWPGKDFEKRNLHARFDRSGITIWDPSAIVLRWDLHVHWSSVAGLSVEGADQVQRRVTVARLLTVGVFALAWQKRLQSSFLTIEINGHELVLASRDRTVHQLRADLAPILRFVSRTGVSPPDAQTPLDAAGRLRRLGSLHDDGTITDEEFDAKRLAILDEL